MSKRTISSDMMCHISRITLYVLGPLPPFPEGFVVFFWRHLHPGLLELLVG